MLPNINPRQMKQAMKKMGIHMDEINAESVVIKCTDKDIVIENPQVVKTVMQGQTMFQISGNIKEQVGEVKVEVSDEDIMMVAEQANVSEDTARTALEESNGDIAGAIMKLKG